MDIGQYIQAIAALLFVICLIAATSFILKRFSIDKYLVKTANTKKRLSIKEVLPIDLKRRVILIERDGVEHLILLGNNSDILLESGIHGSSLPNNEENT